MIRNDMPDVGRTEPEGVDEDGGAGVGDEERADGGAGRGGASFDPTPYLRQLRGRGGGQDYLDVKWRLLWLRREHPDAEIMTEHVRIEGESAIFKATVSLPTGGKATGYGSETASDFGDFIEKAETKAIGRALNALGYGAQFGERGDEEVGPAAVPPAPRRSAPVPRPVAAPRIASRPAPRNAPTTDRAAPPVPSEGREVAPPAAPPPSAIDPLGAIDAAAPSGSGGGRPIDIGAGRDRSAGLAETASPRAADPTGSPTAGDGAIDGAVEGDGSVEAEQVPGRGDEPDMVDYSWSAFWPWARGIGLNGPKAVEGLIGQQVAGMTPAELRALIVAARGEG